MSSEAALTADAGPDQADLKALCGPAHFLGISELHAGYGRMEILHGLDLFVGKGQSLCLIGPNGAGKSTVLHSIFGFTRITQGVIEKDGEDISHLSPNQKLQRAGVAYILQDNSVFAEMTVQENLMMGGYLLEDRHQARDATEQVLKKYPRLAARRQQQAGALSGGERRLLEISRALIMQPQVLLVDEPSIGLEPRYIAQVFELLGELQHTEGKTIIMVEQNAKKGLEFADIGYVLVSGNVAMAAAADELLETAQVGRLFLGG